MAATFINYTIMGRQRFEVYPSLVCAPYRVEDILERTCKRWDVSDQLRHSDFWLVCGIGALNLGRLTVSS